MVTRPGGGGGFPASALLSVAASALLLLLLVAAGGTASSATAQQEATPAAQGGWTAKDCAECHGEEVAALTRTPHAALDREGMVALARVAQSCEACHGDPAEHLRTDGEAEVFTFSASPQRNAEPCLTCHADTHPRFRLSSHAKAGLACVSCHAIHPVEPAPEPEVAADLRGRPSATCVDCHAAEFTQFTFTEHHRLEEGTLECTSCHDPHDTADRPILGGFKQDTCIECHTDKGGPFIFEHPASRVEGCTSCHSPHGSPNRHLLLFQNVAEQCLSCHAVVPSFHIRFTLDTQCTNCHSQIHGSNLDPAFLK
jgi:DmsE family decaheme c-type cytochrome